MVKFVLKVLCTWMPATPKAYFVDTPSMRILRSACSKSAKGSILQLSAMPVVANKINANERIRIIILYFVN